MMFSCMRIISTRPMLKSILHRPSVLTPPSQWLRRNQEKSYSYSTASLTPPIRQSILPPSTLSPLVNLVTSRARSTHTLVSHNPETEELVYVNPNKNYLLMTYASLCTSSVIILGIAANMFWNYFVLSIPPPTDNIENPMLYAFLGNIFGLSLLVATKYLLSRTFIRIYYNPSNQNFTGEGYTWRLGKSKTVFPAGSVRQLDVPAGLSELKGNYLINGRRIYLNSESFKSPMHYNLMLGHVKAKK